jgi:multiphosphoryl transfer protein
LVGIVVVSHSRVLARAAVALAEEMLQGRHVPIVVAAGLDEQTFGTDAVQIHDALVEAEQGDGVVVLMDLGSAVLSAELALDLLEDDDARQRVLLCPAPLVEGLVVAAVTALSGAGRTEVAAEALAALSGKQSQLSPPQLPPVIMHEIPAARTSPEPAGDFVHDHGEVEERFGVTAMHGLHARPAARLVALLRGFDARVELRNASTGSGWVSGASLSRVATLGALQGHEVEVRASGPQAAAAVEQLLALAGRNFDETPQHPAGPVEAPEQLSGGPFAASPGVGIGPARQVGARRPAIAPASPSAAVPRTATSEPQAEWRHVNEAIDAVREQVRTLRARVAREAGESDAAIFDAHLALLDDPELLSDAHSRIDAGQPASAAWSGAVTVAAAGLEALTDPYLQARAADVRAVGDQVLSHLLGTTDQVDERSGVLVAPDLTPARAATLDPGRTVAVVLAFGSPTAHSAILARARGIPAVVGAGPGVLQIADGTPLAVDGTTGELVIDPSEQVIAAFRERATAAKNRDRTALAEAHAPARTKDGVEVLVGANIGSVEDARAAAAAGADLVGLVRTEFLFLGRSQAPDVDEQEAVYRALAEALDGRRITLRTLDVGGDKPLDYLPMPAEANPFLGVRGIRLALAEPRLLADQLLAIVRVAHDVPVSVMFPMVSTLDEVIRARRFLDDAIKQAGRGEPAGLQVGIMIEVPAAALKAATFAPHLDFLSIGTNDLTQYTLAAERGNDAVASLGDPLDPGVLRLIEATCAGAGPQTMVAVCGELAADEKAAAVLVGLGVRELSVTPRAVPGVKQAVRDLLLPEARTVAGRALAASSANAVRELLAASRP